MTAPIPPSCRTLTECWLPGGSAMWPSKVSASQCQPLQISATKRDRSFGDWHWSQTKGELSCWCKRRLANTGHSRSIRCQMRLVSAASSNNGYDKGQHKFKSETIGGPVKSSRNRVWSNGIHRKPLWKASSQARQGPAGLLWGEKSHFDSTPCKRDAVICNDVSGVIAFVVKFCNQDEHEIKIGVDGGGGTLKVTLSTSGPFGNSNHLPCPPATKKINLVDSSKFLESGAKEADASCSGHWHTWVIRECWDSLWSSSCGTSENDLGGRYETS